MEKKKFSPQRSAKCRLDQIVAKYCDVSRSQAKKWLDSGLVTVNGVPEKKAGFIVKAVDTIEVAIPEKIIPTKALGHELEIIYENAGLIIVSKPAGIVTHPDAHYQTDSLLQRVLAHSKLSSIGLPDRPGVVHRLDKDTSGLVIFAKTDQAHRELTAIFADRKIEKYYIALVHGGSKLPDSGSIDSPISRHIHDRKKMDVSASEKAKHAVSHFTVLERFLQATLLSVRIETGRTHQIRVHFSAIGFPVVGDSTYGNAKLDQALSQAVQTKIPRLFLHAQRLKFTIPGETVEREFVAEIPEELEKFMEKMR